MMLRNKEVAAPIRPPILSAALLEKLFELNDDYVALLAAHAADSNADARALPDRVYVALAQLSQAARSRLARIPFALFSLGFEDLPFWRGLLRCDGVADDASRPARYQDFSARPGAAFCEVALFFAWHAAAMNRVAGKVLFAMTGELAEGFAQTPLWRLRQIARECPDLIQPRWPANPRFWPDLVKFAAAEDWQRLQTTQLLGSQLTAVELEQSAANVRIRRFRRML